jgi:hypothetical protein
VPRTSDEALRRATDRARGVWFARLDAWGAVRREHREIAAWLRREQGVDDWWVQTITVDYEHARGLRPPGGQRDGTCSVNASRTIAAPIRRIFEAFVQPRLRDRWLPSDVLRLRTARSCRSARFDWKEGATRVHVYFASKGIDRGQAALVHERIPDARTAKKLKAFWSRRLDALRELLEARP